MDQQELRRLENQCIQEQLPGCTAACPLHIDVRAFIGLLAQENWGESLKVLRKTMPLPNILGRICDAPCEDHCKRSEAGEAVRIGALERACVSQPASPQKPMILPAKGKNIAVIGSGLSGLTMAWDGLRKGYGVKIFELGRVLGETVRGRYAGLLPGKIIEEETALLIKLGLEVEVEAGVYEPDFLDRCLKTYSAVYLSLEALSTESWDLEKEVSGRIKVEPQIQRTSREGIFAGGLPYQGRISPVWQAAEGRWAANSIDRFLQKVSLTAGREKEGPLPTRLFTSLTDVQPLPVVPAADPGSGYTPEEARQEGGRCLKCQCLECVKVCVYLERFRGYPKKYAREIYNNESIVMGSRLANKLINSCSLCGLCEVVCPESFAMQDLCLQTRRSMVRRGKMPPSAHEFALLDMAFNQSERFSLARHEPGLEESIQVFFPGCQLCGSTPEKVSEVYAHLRSTLSGGVGLMLGCCAAPAYWAGQEDLFARSLEGIKRKWHDLGNPRMILACSTCLRIFKDHLPDIPVISLWQVLEKTWQPIESAHPDSVTLAIHDPCTSRHEPAVQAAVRCLLQRLNRPIEELGLGQEKTECCGFGGLQFNANPELAREAILRRAQRSERDYLTYCAMCRDSLTSVRKRVVHLLDLLFPDPHVPDPALRPRSGWSQKQESRSRLKNQLLQDLWSEKPKEMEEYQKIPLQIEPSVQVLLEKRRILEDDLKKVIYQAEKSGQKFYDPSTGRFKAGFKPVKATFWVEYGPSEDGFIVYKAYFHRMEVTVS